VLRTREMSASVLLACVCICSVVSCQKADADLIPAASTTASVPPPTATPTSSGASTSAGPSPVTAAPATSMRPSSDAQADTLRGTLQRVGNDPVSVLVLMVNASADANATPYALRGTQRALLERVTGLELVVRGTQTTERDMQAAPRGAAVFRVQEFEVRASEGVAAVDGVVSVQDGAYALVTQSGRRVSTPQLPAELRNQIGARVFLTGALQQPPSAYGIISARP